MGCASSAPESRSGGREDAEEQRFSDAIVKQQKAPSASAPQRCALALDHM